ncbi:F-box/LRR-repeat protein At3g58900-like isoform X2 [Cornus florida]|uniref:F-box/LRR-repeat protein At3g58900-like isoform X2 n=1 Tax=Cornus florida TaxID=4283 RepID=UPI0028968453|nr:F-box/LRR-repeat protein At3g58900-like isoform X2 [Cornus florida]
MRGEHMKDGISGLPDEILITILSLLTLREAACTSILSSRWRYLWRYITVIFNFDSKTLLRAPVDNVTSSSERERERERECDRERDRLPIHIRERERKRELVREQEKRRTKYVSCVNKVLKLHLGSSIDEMRISFNFAENYPRDIDDWIKFAMEKRVQRFEFNVFAETIPTRGRQYYDFPSMENFKFLFRNSRSHIGSAAGFSSLTALRLVGVNIMEEVLENFLSNCPFLEQLYIVGTTCLVNLKIAGSSLKLKCLEISHCHCLKILEISAANLVSFTYLGQDISVPFKNVPLLSELSIAGPFCSSFVFGSCKHSSYIPQIEKLKLKVFSQEFFRFPIYFRELGNLKHVELSITGGFAGCSLLRFTSVIKASPNLSKFSVRMTLGDNGRQSNRCWKRSN